MSDNPSEKLTYRGILMRLSIIHRISAGFIVLMLCLVAIAWVGINRTSSVNVSLQEIVSEAIPVGALMAEVKSQLSSINLIMYRHYHSTEHSELAEYENEFDDILEQLSFLNKNLINKISIIHSNEAALNELSRIEKQIPKLSDEIKQVMALYRSSVADLERLAFLNQRVLEIEKRFTEMHEFILDQDLSGNHMRLMNESQLLLVRGIDRAKIIALATEYTDTQGFLIWQNDMFEVGEKLRSLSNLNQNVSNTLIARSDLISDLVLMAVGTGGLIETRHSYVVRKDILLDSIDKNREQIKNIEKAYSVIEGFTKKYIDETSSQSIQTVQDGKITIIIASLISIASGIFVTFIVISAIKKPLRKIVSQLKRLEDGDLSQNIHIDRDDEFGLLQSSFRSLNAHLRKIILAIQTESLELSASSNEAEHDSNEINNSIEAQERKIENIASAMDQMTLATSQIASKTISTLSEMNHAYGLANSSQEQININKQGILKLQEDINETSDVIENLNTSLFKIEEIVKVIDNIANQTNLLALNAAIEAARAGEKGRGFAIVAEEVRTLADLTSNSTGEIQDTIQDILEKSKLTVSSIRDARHRTDENVDHTISIFKKVGSVVEILKLLKDLNTQIAAAAEQQETSTREVNSNIQEISRLSQKAVVQTQESRIRSAELNKTSNKLRILIERFSL